MVGHFLRLKLTLFRNSLRGDATRVFGVVIGLVFAALIGLGGGVGIAFLHGRDAAATVGPLLYLLLVLGWVLVPLITFAADETLDPTRLSLLPLSERDLVSGLLAASLVGAPAFATTLLVLGGSVGFAGRWALVPVAVVAALCELALCLGTSRAVAASASGLLRSRRGRDLAVLLGVLVAVLAQGVNLGARALDTAAGLSALDSTAAIVRWTPPGAAARAPVDLATGHWVAGIGELAIALVSVVVVLWWWGHALRHALTTVDSSTQVTVRRDADAGGGDRTVLGWTVPARTMAVARRELRYARREPRRRAGWVSTAVFGMIVPVVYAVTDAVPGSVISYWVCATALVVGLQSLNQFGLEGSALWLHVVTTSTARDARLDLAGRNLAHVVIAVPVLAVTSLFIGAFTGDFAPVAGAFGLSLGLYGAALGAGNVMSALVPYAVPERGGTFAGPGPGRGCVVGLIGMGAMAAAVGLCLPLVAVLGVLAWQWPAGTALLIVLGPAYGAALAAWGRRIGAGRFTDRMPEVLTQVRRDSAA